MKKIMFNDKYGLTKAVLEGRKTMTRRIIKDENGLYADIRCMQFSHINDKGQAVMRSAIGFATLWPAYHSGDVVAVAQKYRECVDDILVKWGHRTDIAVMLFKRLPGWDNKMFVRADLMPHRIRITDIKVERLQDISDEDCLREGIFWDYGDYPYMATKMYKYNEKEEYIHPKAAFAALIDKVSGKGTWERNPWVFVYEFELVEG